MGVRRISTNRAVAAALAGVCLCLAGAVAAPAAIAQPTTRPARNVAGPGPAGTSPAPQAANQAAARVEAPGPVRPPTTAPAPIHSEVGQRLIRRPDGAAPATRPVAPVGSTASGSGGDGGVQSVAPSLGLSKVAGALAIVLTLIFALRHVMKRAFGVAGAGASSRAVVVLSRTVLAPRQQVMLLHVGRRLIVVGDSGGQMSTLSEITDPDEVAALVGQLRDEKLSSAAPAFGGLLGRLRGGMESGSSSFDTNTDHHAATTDEGDDRADGDQNGDDPKTGPTRQEINGLLAKVRLLSHQFKGT